MYHFRGAVDEQKKQARFLRQFFGEVREIGRQGD
jgi:hypothetical protein